MKGRVRTFGEDVRHFAQSLDILDQQLCNRATEVILHYLERHLDLAYFEIVAEQVVNEARGLKTVFCNRDEEHSATLYDRDGQYTRQISLCFAEGTPMWIVNPEREPPTSSSALSQELATL